MKQSFLLVGTLLASTLLTPLYAATYTYKALSAFNGSEGASPSGGLVRDGAGNLYGTTEAGGKYGFGVVYKIKKSGAESVLHDFTGGSDGQDPKGSLALDAAGNLYGTAYQGGTTNSGVVFKISAAGHFTALHEFTGSDGCHPLTGTLLLDSAGNVYGTAGGCGTYGWRVLFKIDTSNNYTILYAFTGGTDGATPFAGVIADASGNLYGTTTYGGAAGSGVAYELDTTGTYNLLHTFRGGLNGNCFAAEDGCLPTAGVVMDVKGNLYGTTQYGGSSNYGMVYKITAGGKFSVLYSFTNGADGNEPSYDSLVRDSAGNLYGTIQNGRASTSSAGLVYELNTSHQLTVLYTFSGSDGANPDAGVIRDSSGNLYGTASNGGPNGFGSVFELKP